MWFEYPHRPEDLEGRKPEGRIISFIDQPEVIKKILQHLGLWEESQAPPEKSQEAREMTFDPPYSQLGMDIGPGLG